jgi:hypothetical protein
MPTDDYYDTRQFPETYTGYDGSKIWDFIHDRIAFEGYDYDDDHWKADFNKAVSGLHAMISTQIVRGIQERIEDGEGFSDEEVWTDPDVEFHRRLGTKGEVPMALENLYFCYMLQPRHGCVYSKIATLERSKPMLQKSLEPFSRQVSWMTPPLGLPPKSCTTTPSRTLILWRRSGRLECALANFYGL